MSKTVNIGKVTVFDHPEATKEQALKILEEAAETVEAFKEWERNNANVNKGALCNEIADTIQACANLIAALGVEDFTGCMEIRKKLNIASGRITEEPEPELKPCPFCGGEAGFDGDEHSGYYAICGNNTCDIDPYTILYDTKAEAAKIWNTRAGVDDE